MKSLLGALVSFALLTALHAAEEQNVPSEKPTNACSIKMKTGGKCDEDGNCPYQVTLPPMTIQLPKQFQLLEKTLKEVQSLKEMVSNLKKSCQDCKLQADDNLEKDKDEVPNEGQINQIQDLQSKVKKMSISLKNARSQINTLQGQLEKMNSVSMNNVEEYIDSKVANLSSEMNSWDKCSYNCPLLKPNTSMQFIYKDCADYFKLGKRLNGVYHIMPDPKNKTFDVYCDMESMGGGWTLVQSRQDGSINFNRTWNEYKNGFGNLTGEFWLGNDKIHLLTKSSNMMLRIELEDFKGVKEHATYDQFYVANEYLKYRLSVSGYSGTAGDALLFSKQYSHDQKSFTTPDKDNDRYPSGNCGAYYSSGWWFDACMSANLNGKYYRSDYKGVRNGIFWGTWKGVDEEHISSFRQAFKNVRMMIRPKDFSSS
ncbi:PREDICTED: fibroleukin [Nanorana parkeri]|uniref:fibroleukin n=1 Tax=Nanorana parkeri TaxID=125878 RepID=UPI000854F7CB|nr:PREDICTED: fibroleukin [Nanorana parkeri]